VTTATLSSTRPVAEHRVSAARARSALLPLVVLLWCYALYDMLRTSVTGSLATAVTNAGRITSLEHAVGLDIEGRIQRAALHVPWLVDACNYCYSLTHLLAPPIVLVVLYVKAPARFRVARNALLALLALALLCFWLFPVAPPRLVPGPSHLADTSQSLGLDHTPLAGLVAAKNESATPTWAGSTNPFAAMPSLHVGWAVWASLALWPLLRRRWMRLVALIYPAAMLLSVVVTGNHWLLDGLAGAVLAAVTLAAAAAWERHRRVASRDRWLARLPVASV
jgi:membrane-associated phospholipid phosphatase